MNGDGEECPSLFGLAWKVCGRTVLGSISLG